MLPRTDFRSLARAFSTSNKKLRGWPPPPGDPEVKFFTQAGSIKFFFLSLLGSSTHLLPIFMTISSSTSEQGRKNSIPVPIPITSIRVRRSISFGPSIFIFTFPPSEKEGGWGEGCPFSASFLEFRVSIDIHHHARWISFPLFSDHLPFLISQH